MGTLRRRRLLGAGGTRLRRSAEFYEALGDALAGEPGLILCTGGFKHRLDEPESRSADFSIAVGFRNGLERRNEPVDE